MSKSTLQGLAWSLTPEEIATKTDSLISQTEKAIASVASIPVKDVSFSNVLKPLTDLETEYTVLRNALDFFQHVHPDKARRDASTEADKKLSAFEVKMSMNKDIFDRIAGLPKDQQSGESRRYLDRKMKHGKRNGLHLDETLRKKVEEIKKKESELGITFQKNLTEVDIVLKFTREQLDGLPDDFIESLEKSDEGYHVTLKYPHVFPVMKKCRVSKTRHAVDLNFNSRCKDENSKILQQLVDLRREKALLLGYQNHASFIHEMRMAENPAKVKAFLAALSLKMKPLGEKDIQTMLKMKKEDCEKYQEEFDGKINMWDMRFYATRIEEEMYSVDQAKLKEYFPMETVTKGLLKIYESLLGLRYEKVENPEVWHEDVSLYKVFDAADGRLIGHFYLDLYPREGKYGHAACFGLIPGCLKRDGSRLTAVAAMVANFTKPTATAPSLLLHDEVETYFHEFGHVMHQICSEAENSMFSGTAVERDFVEAPSQMLENWCWEKEPLNIMSGHYKTGEKLPDDMIETLTKSRNANTGVFYLRQITLATLDLELHTMSTTPDVAKVYSDCCSKILGIPATANTCMPASFGHLAGGYDAQYYGYLWSEVFCFDMFYSRFKKEGIMSPKVGIDYRQKILRPGGSIDATDMLKDFLGREPKQDAFLAAKGLTV